MPDGTVKQIAVDASNGRGWIGDMGFGRLDDMRVRSGPSDTDLRWPGGVVHYCFLRSPLDSSLDPRVDEEPVVEGAAAYIHARVPSVSFVRHGYCSELAPPADDVVIVRRHVEDGQNQDWSRADLGRQGGVQYLDLGFSVGQDGPTDGMLTVVHELMHSLGVYHEHQRPDRDAHVGICWLNVSRQGDYEIKDDQLILSKYDPHSRMHYRPNQNRIDNPIDLPAPCGTNTMYSLDASVSLEHNNNMTAEDINNLSAMYGYGIGLPVAGEGLGAAIAVGNFDGDAYDDIAIGAPNGSNGAGRVYLFKGTLRYPLGRRVLTSTAAKGDGFGSALASGDFNGDGIMDLAVGAPGSKVSGVASGAVIIYLGGRFRGALWDPTCAAGSPCDGTGTDMLDLPSRTITLGGALGSPTPAAGDELGAALVAGDFDGDGHDDLVVGAPGRNGGQGAAYFFRGRMLAPPPGTPPQPYLYQAITPASLGAPSARRFGASLARGDFDDDRKNDLALGAPGLTNSTAPAYAFVMKGTGTSIPAAWQAIPSPNGAGDEFGFAVASGRLFGDDNKAELIVGAPRTLNSHSVRAGAVHVYRWASGSPSAQMVHADELVTGASTEARFGHAVQALNFDVTGQWELAIGSPLYGGGRGRILMATSNGTSLSTGNDVVGTGDVYQLGRSLAAIVQQVGVEIPGLSNVVRLLAGAPASKAEAPFGFSNAGRVVGYAETGANAFSPLTKLTPMTRSPAAE